MADAIKKWQCNFCESENAIVLDKELQICGTCGLCYLTKMMIHSANGDWLQCLPVTNLSRKTPSDFAGEMWIDQNRERFSRNDYINKYAIDPKVFWEYRHRAKGANAQIRF
jgi:hypothetical protein